MAKQLSFDFEPAVNAKSRAGRHADYMREYHRRNADHINAMRRARRQKCLATTRSREAKSWRRQREKDPIAFNKRAASQMAKWRLANPAKVRASKRRRYQRTKADHPDRIRQHLRNRLNEAIRKGYRSGSAVGDLGCSIEDFKTYIASMFRPGMTWNNWGRGKGRWNLDHKTPLASVDLTDRDQFLRVMHWSNYQPLWSEDNIKKGAIQSDQIG